MDAKLTAALAAGRTATDRMGGAMTTEEYLDADAFRTVDRLLATTPKPNTRK